MTCECEWNKMCALYVANIYAKCSQTASTINPPPGSWIPHQAHTLALLQAIADLLTTWLMHELTNWYRISDTISKHHSHVRFERVGSCPVNVWMLTRLQVSTLCENFWSLGVLNQDWVEFLSGYVCCAGFKATWHAFWCMVQPTHCLSNTPCLLFSHPLHHLACSLPPTMSPCSCLGNPVSFVSGLGECERVVDITGVCCQCFVFREAGSIMVCCFDNFALMIWHDDFRRGTTNNLGAKGVEMIKTRLAQVGENCHRCRDTWQTKIECACYVVLCFHKCCLQEKSNKIIKSLILCVVVLNIDILGTYKTKVFLHAISM